MSCGIFRNSITIMHHFERLFRFKLLYECWCERDQNLSLVFALFLRYHIWLFTFSNVTFVFLSADGGGCRQFCLGIDLKCSLYFAGPCCGNTLWCLRQPALQQIMWCHHYLVCAARGLHNLNKQTDKNIISTLHSQHVAAALFTCDARHPTLMSAASSSSAQSSQRCEREPCKLCRAVEESPSFGHWN